ncbi:hypothetical protein S40285_10615 [Stachybotrys chlorohalonatus IBT 40285]|uniref:Uncharacterized protein n=1 Tax=Stachybotrys chlorohalonatus (strain IBT 40285) TaxID=1283841 RepID=A0A084QYE6_STAC4|nr:hypothetical protein S40285_10615 [Stachybotrys chlorohalonata IBT 40285]
MQEIDPAIPSWSWASVGYKPVKNSWKEILYFQALAVVEKVDLVEQHHTFGAVKGGRVTITGPLIKLPRLYHKEWESTEASISEHERHISKIIKKESRGDVEHKYYLLVLEATGATANGNEYRRVGVLTVRYFHKDDVAPPEIIDFFKEMDASLTARLQES